MTVSVLSGPALPLAWISIFKPVYVTDGYQDSEVETQVLPVARKKEFIERLGMFVIISFAGFDPYLSQNAGGVLSLIFFFLIRVIHITKFTSLKCTISGF